MWYKSRGLQMYDLKCTLPWILNLGAFDSVIDGIRSQAPGRSVRKCPYSSVFISSPHNIWYIQHSDLVYSPCTACLYILCILIQYILVDLSTSGMYICVCIYEYLANILNCSCLENFAKCFSLLHHFSTNAESYIF